MMSRLIIIFVISAMTIIAVPFPTDASNSTAAGTTTTKKPTAIKPSATTTTKKPLTLDGGYSAVAVDDAAVKEMASFALVALPSTNNSLTSLVKILSASKQVVAGVNYNMSLQLMQGSSNTLITCQVIVFDQVWTGTRELTSSVCQ